MTEEYAFPSLCPPHCQINASVPMAHVADVDRAAEFYRLLGFRCDSRFVLPSGATNWMSLRSHDARIMLVQATEPVVSSQQAVLFSMYGSDVAALRSHLLSQGIPDAGGFPSEQPSEHLARKIPSRYCVFAIRHPFYMPEGEWRIHDPDGSCILVGQLEPSPGGPGTHRD